MPLMIDTGLSASAIADRIPDGSFVGVPKEDSGAAMAVTLALIRRGARNLRLLTVPVGSLQADLLIGAGCVTEIETSGVSMGEFGFAPRFREAVENGRIAIRDATCPAIYASLQAAEKGVPFMPLRGLLGSDVFANRPDWKVIDNPFGEGDAVAALPPLQPDIALFHARYGDAHGNVWTGAGRECAILAHAAQRTFVTVEELFDGNLMDDDALRPGTIAAVYVDDVALAPGGARPLPLAGCYGRDAECLRAYTIAARTADGFDAWLRNGAAAA